MRDSLPEAGFGGFSHGGGGELGSQGLSGEE